MKVGFNENNLAESGYGALVYWWSGSGWVYMDARYFMNGIAPKAHPLQFLYRKPAPPTFPDGLYRVCLYEDSVEHPGSASSATCASSRVLDSTPAYDRDIDGFSDEREAGNIRCYNGVNDDAGDDTRVDDGCPAYGGLREEESPLPSLCENLGNDDFPDDMFINDGCPQIGTFAEGSYNIGTNADALCASTPAPNDEPVDAWPVDFNDDQAVNTTDVLALKPVFNTAVPPSSPRFDLNVSGAINTTDVLAIKPYFGNFCTPGG
jgi:hypothetical protein